MQIETDAPVRSLYSPHPAFAMESASMKNLQHKTGKSLDDWIEVVKASGPPTERERAAWLKTQHGLGTNVAIWIAERAAGKNRVADYHPEAMVAAMYAGPKAGLWPLYDRLLQLGLGLAADVQACPCVTIVPLYRKHVFAQLKPTTRTRIDLGLALKDAPAIGRLIDTGGLAKRDRITHRIPISSIADIDEEVTTWLRAAYDLDAGPRTVVISNDQ